jgi:hypothetical protein
MERALLLAFAASALALGACAPLEPPAAAPAPAAAPGVEVHLPPADRCALAEPERRPPPQVAPDTAPLSVQVGPKGVSLEATGASAGRVLIGIAAATGQAMRVDGYGASVRIYAHVVDRPWEPLVDSIASAAGLEVRRAPGEDLVIVDPTEAVRLERSRRAGQIDLAPLETRVVPARHSAEAAPVLARLLLGCGGEIIAAPRSALIVLRDRGGNLDRMEALIQALERQPPARIEMDLDRPPGPIRYGVPDATRPSCDAIAEVPAPPLPEGRLYAAGAAAGDVMRQIARAHGQDVVVGCGGDRPAFFWGAPGLDPGEVAPKIGLASIDQTTFTSAAVGQKLRWLSVIRRGGEGPYHLRGLLTPRAAELAAVAGRILSRSAAAVAYAPASLLLVGGSPADIDQTESLVKAWDELTGDRAGKRR